MEVENVSQYISDTKMYRGLLCTVRIQQSPDLVTKKVKILEIKFSLLTNCQHYSEE